MEKERMIHAFILIIISCFVLKSCKGLTLTTSSDNAIIGVEFTFTCVTTDKSIIFDSDGTDVCSITGGNTDGTCVFSGSYIEYYTYTCNPTTNTYTVTIPGSYLTDSLHETIWKCQNLFGGGTSNTKILYVNVPVSSVTLLSTPTDRNPVEVVSNRDQTFSCTTNAARPSSRIQWYLSTTNITTSASPQPDVCNTDCSDDKITSSSVLTYTGNITDDDKILYCTAVNIEGWRVVRSSDKTIDIWYGPNMVNITPSSQSYTLKETENLNQIQCTADCRPVCAMTWTGPNLPANTTSVLNLQNINRNQTGNYQCTASNAVSSNTSVVVNVVVQYQPTTLHIITQTPVGPIIEGNKVTLTCTIQGGNPVATITWSCDGAAQITPTGSPSTLDAISSVELVTSKNNNEQICTCTGRHLLWTDDKTQQHNITVYYEPTSTPSIMQTPPGPINESSSVILTCDIQGGNPPATITWTCEGASLFNPTGSPPTNTATSSVQLTVNGNDNGRMCTCVGHHPVWTIDNTTGHALDVRYEPTTSPTITQTPVEPIIEGNKVTLTCTIQGGNPVATITWSCDGAAQITPTGSPSTVDAISSVELVTSKNTNGQICTCTGRHLLWTNDSIQQHTITVYYSPTVSITNTNPLDVVENVTLQLACQVLDANPTVNWFSWYKGSSTKPIGMLSNFNISKVNRTVSGEYRCEGSNGIGQNGTDTVYVNVLYNPEITHLSVIDSNEILENNTATMQCNVESNPLSNVEWTFENRTLNEGNPDVLQSNYTIQRAKCEDTGFYMCTATNIINMESYSDKRVVQLSVKCSPRRDIMFEPPENQIRLALGQHLKMQIHIIAYPPPVVEWRFRSAHNSTTETLSSNCKQTNMFKHTACFEKDNVTEADFGQYSVIVHNELGNNFSYLFNVNPQGPPDMSSNVNTSCKVLSADILWTTGFHGGKQQQFYVLVLDVKTRITKIYNTHQFGDEKNEDKSYNIALQPGLYSFKIFGNNSFGNATSGESTCQVNGKTSESDSVIAVAAGTGSAAAALIIGVVVVIIVLRKRMVNAKGNENSDDKGRLNMTPMDGDEVVEGLQENDCYVSAGPHFRPKDTSAANYEVVEKKGQSNAKDVKQDSQETSLHSILDKKSSAKGKTTSGEKTKDGPDQNEDVYENFTNQGSSDNQKQNVNKDGLQYSELVFNPLQNGSKFIIHGIEDTTIYAEVDITQKIDPLPESDDEDKGNEA